MATPGGRNAYGAETSVARARICLMAPYPYENEFLLDSIGPERGSCG